MKKLINGTEKRVWSIRIELGYGEHVDSRAKAKLIERILNKKNYINNISFSDHRIEVDVYGVTEAFYLMNNHEILMNRSDKGDINNVELSINSY